MLPRIIPRISSSPLTRAFGDVGELQKLGAVEDAETAVSLLVVLDPVVLLDDVDAVDGERSVIPCVLIPCSGIWVLDAFVTSARD